MDIQFAYTILYVKDVEQTLAFYQEVFGFEPKLLVPTKDYGELKSGETTLAFAALELGRANLKGGFQESQMDQPPFGIELAFTTEAVDELMAKAINSGARLLEAAVTKPWGQKVGYIQDPNGFLIEICTPIQD